MSEIRQNTDPVRLPRLLRLGNKWRDENDRAGRREKSSARDH